jgi:hypothetical protein
VPHAARTPGFVVVMAPPRKRRKYDANPSSDETFAPAKSTRTHIRSSKRKRRQSGRLSYQSGWAPSLRSPFQ